MARACHTAASSRPARTSSLVEGARASLRLGVVQQRALPPVRPMASTAAIIELTLCRGETSSAVGCGFWVGPRSRCVGEGASTRTDGYEDK